MKKSIILLWLGALTVVSCTKQNEINETTIPVQLKIQAIDKDNTVVESNILLIK